VRRLDRYVGRTVLASILLVLAVIVGLDALSALLDESEDISQTYTFARVMLYVALTIPARIYEFVPFAALIGCLIGLGQLATTSELVVMRSSGVSVGRLVWVTMKPALLLVIAAVLVGEYVAPRLEQIAESQRSIALSSKGGGRGARGLWNREGNTFMHFNAVQTGGVLYGITLLQFNDRGELQSTLRAARASFQGDHWSMEDVQRAELTSWQGAQSRFATLRWDTNVTPDLLSILVLSPDSLSARELFVYSRYLALQGLDADDYRLALWKKILQPLGVASLVLVAISFIFGPLRDGSMGFRIFAGVVVGIVFRTSQDLLGPASLVFGFSPVYAVLGPILVCALVGVVLLRRAA
jgi:lipopolysaccharide export system permease protein